MNLQDLDPLRIPEKHQVSAYLTLMVTTLANAQALRLQLAHLQGMLDRTQTPEQFFDFYDARMKSIGENLRADLYAKFGE